MTGWLDRITGREYPGLLIVDDDDNLRRFVRALLADEEVGDMWDAPDGETALEISYVHHPRIVVLDYEMPRMNGQAVARMMRLISPGARIVLLTAVLPDEPDWAHAYLQKDDIDRLPEVVRDQIVRLAIG